MGLKKTWQFQTSDKTLVTIFFEDKEKNKDLNKEDRYRTVEMERIDSGSDSEEEKKSDSEFLIPKENNDPLIEKKKKVKEHFIKLTPPIVMIQAKNVKRKDALKYN